MTFLKKSQRRSGRNKIIVIVGPTASGKSSLAVKLAKKINGEIISADSRQVYKGLNLASGKVTKKEVIGIPHHCLDLVSPKTVFTAERYAQCAQHAIKDILERKKTPIIVGGTGFYIDAALGRIAIPKIPPDWKLRRSLEKKSQRELFSLLERMDLQRAKTIEPENKRRLIRAIEIAKSLKKKLGGKNQPVSYMIPADTNIIWFGIKIWPKQLREKINKRLEKRLKTGMIEEIKHLRKNGVSWKRLDELGLEPRWIARYLRGLITYDAMVSRLQSSIWRYSRRQMTWFKKNKNIKWVTPKAGSLKLF